MSKGLFSIIPKRFDYPSLDIYKDFDYFFNSLGDGFSKSNSDLRRTTPMANVLKTENGFCIEMAAPGFSRGDFNIDVDKGMINISAKTENNSSNESFTSREFYYSSFLRSWNLPDSANLEGISASYESGILNVNIPTTETKTKKLSINID